METHALRGWCFGDGIIVGLKASRFSSNVRSVSAQTGYCRMRLYIMSAAYEITCNVTLPCAVMTKYYQEAADSGNAADTLRS